MCDKRNIATHGSSQLATSDFQLSRSFVLSFIFTVRELEAEEGENNCCYVLGPRQFMYEHGRQKLALFD